MLTAFVHVALGGALGSVLRYAVALAGLRLFGPGFPVGTLAVNVIGSLAMGYLAIGLAPHLRPALMTGVLGGFTTFSAFALDTALLWERGAPAMAAVYVLASVGLSLLSLLGGMMIGRALA